MKTFLQFLLEDLKVYRGVMGPYDHNHTGGRPGGPIPVVFVSTSLEHATMYTNGEGEVRHFSISASDMDIMDLGFRAAETEVPYEEVASRIKNAIQDRYASNRISHKDALEQVGVLSVYKPTGHHAVWEWMDDATILKVVVSAGFNCFRQREGKVKHVGNVEVYGILDKSILKEE